MRKRFDDVGSAAAHCALHAVRGRGRIRVDAHDASRLSSIVQRHDQEKLLVAVVSASRKDLHANLESRCLQHEAES